MNPRYGLEGKLLKARIEFVAATQGQAILGKGGAWLSNAYSIQVQALARQFDTILVASVLNLTDYYVDVDQQRYLYTSDGTATALEIRDGLIAKINAGSPGNGLLAAIVDGTHFSILGLKGGIYHQVDPVPTLLTNAPSLETIPNYSAFKDDGRIVVRTSAAFSGAFDVLVQG